MGSARFRFKQNTSKMIASKLFNHVRQLVWSLMNDAQRDPGTNRTPYNCTIVPMLLIAAVRTL
jgi:hypothetical protein